MWNRRVALLTRCQNIEGGGLEAENHGTFRRNPVMIPESAASTLAAKPGHLQWQGRYEHRSVSTPARDDALA